MRSCKQQSRRHRLVRSGHKRPSARRRAARSRATPERRLPLLRTVSLLPAHTCTTCYRSLARVCSPAQHPPCSSRRQRTTYATTSTCAHAPSVDSGASAPSTKPSAEAWLQELLRRPVLAALRTLQRQHRDKTSPFLRGVYGPVHREVHVEGCKVVEGQVPAELDGVYLRTGPNPQHKPVGGCNMCATSSMQPAQCMTRVGCAWWTHTRRAA